MSMTSRPRVRTTLEALRRPSSSDLGDINRLLAQLSPHVPRLTAAGLAKVVANRLNHLLVARAGDRIVGMGSLVMIATVGGRRARIEDVVVDEPYRGRHLGRRLTRALIEVARAERAAEVELSSNPRRRAAHAVYRSIGFEQKRTNVYLLCLRKPPASVSM